MTLWISLLLISVALAWEKWRMRQKTRLKHFFVDWIINWHVLSILVSFKTMHLQSWVDGNFWEMKHCSGGELSTVFTQRWVAVVAFLKQRWGSEEEQQKVTWSKLIESSHVFFSFYFWRCDFSCFDGHEKLGDRDLIWYVFFMGPTWQGYIHIHRPLINPIDYLIFLYILFHFQYAKKACVCFSFNFAYNLKTWCRNTGPMGTLQPGSFRAESVSH